ncbi:MAG: MCE family protein [Pararhodobacter sp.]|nr:MCE family protein [Pararhodobacter sp.]
METRANFILIGVFTLAGFLGLLAFFMWFARFELDRQFAYYDIHFPTVSGLSRASDVRFSGLPVGQVVHVGLSPEDDGTVLVRVEIDAGTPVRADSVATIEAQGVTGVSFLAISAGSPDEPRLALVSDRSPPVIDAGRSVLQTLTEDAPEILGGALVVLQQLSELLGEENQARVDSILANLEASSANFSSALDDLGSVSESVALAATGIAEFAERLDDITAAGTQTMETATATLTNLSDLATQAQGTLGQGDEALASVTATFDSARLFLDTELPALVSQLSEATAELRTNLAGLTADAQGLITEYTATGAAATARLNEAEATLVATDAMIAQLNETLATVGSAAGRFDTLLEEDGAALVAEARAAVAGANTAITTISAIAENDLPAIIADVRTATATANRVVTQVGGDLSTASGRIEGLAEGAASTMAALSETFGNANVTLAAINDALASGERTLEAAEMAFTGANRVINEDISGITSQLRQTMARLDTAIAQVSDDIPTVTAELRAAAETANAAFAEMAGIVGTAGGAVTNFATTGLPEYTRLAQETRTLITSLERLTRQIEREPARFFLDRQTPEFRR